MLKIRFLLPKYSVLELDQRQNRDFGRSFQKHFFNDHTYKVDIGQHFRKNERNLVGRCHRHKKSKQCNRSK